MCLFEYGIKVVKMIEFYIKKAREREYILYTHGLDFGNLWARPFYPNNNILFFYFLSKSVHNSLFWIGVCSPTFIFIAHHSWNTLIKKLSHRKYLYACIKSKREKETVQFTEHEDCNASSLYCWLFYSRRQTSISL